MRDYWDDVLTATPVSRQRANAVSTILQRVRNNGVLEKDAKTFYGRIADPETLRKDITWGAGDRTDAGIINRTYASADGLVLGETHTSPVAKTFLLDNMDTLQRNNVKTLYMEGVVGRYLQPDLDRFHASGQMPERLRNALVQIDRACQLPPASGYRALVESAQAHGMRVVGIETQAATGRVGVNRIRDYNYFATIFINEQQAQSPGRWVFITGEHHAMNINGATVGIAEGTGAVSVVVTPSTGARNVRFDAPTQVDMAPGQTLTARPNVLLEVTETA